MIGVEVEDIGEDGVDCGFDLGSIFEDYGFCLNDCEWIVC